MMRLISRIVAALVLLLGVPAMAQQAATVQRVGFLGPAPSPPFEAFRKAMADIGYIEGRNLVIESRWPDGDQLDRMRDATTALVNLKVDAIVAIGATAVRAAKAVTTEVPIVFVVVVHPVATELVANLDRPGGNVTGLTIFDPQLARKQIDIVRETLPGIARIALLGDAGAAASLFQAVEDAAREAGVQTVPLKVERSANPDFEGAIESARKDGASAMVVLSTPVTTPNRKRIADLAIKHRMPTLTPREHADAGGLLSYGTGFTEAARHATVHVDKILKGAKPGELAVETVRNNELIVNLRTAEQIGVTVPPGVLAGASQVIR